MYARKVARNQASKYAKNQHGTSEKLMLAKKQRTWQKVCKRSSKELRKKNARKAGINQGITNAGKLARNFGRKGYRKVASDQARVYARNVPGTR